MGISYYSIFDSRRAGTNKSHMVDLDELSTRQLQKESARALATMVATNNNIFQFNKQAHHNSWLWYKAVINWYVEQYGDLPSNIGPGKDVKLVYDEDNI